MSFQSRLQSLIEEDAVAPGSVDSFFDEIYDTVVEEAWQEKVQREGIRLEDEPWYMTFPFALVCRKRKAYYEKMAREEQDPVEAQKARNVADFAQLMEDQVIFAGSGQRRRLSPEAAKAREEEFARQTEVLHRRIAEDDAKAKAEDAGGEVSKEKKKKRSKGKKRAKKTQPGSMVEPVNPSDNKS